MASEPAVPTGEQIADYYRSLGPLLQMAWDDNFHIGYWEGPDDTSTVAEATDRFTDLLINRMGVGAGDHVLDVGCGIGKPALRVARSTGATVTGITISRQQVQQATERSRLAHMSHLVTFEYANGMDMPYASASFDAVLSFESINHMDRPTALREMARVLRPGGRLVLTDVTVPEETYQVPDDPGAVTSLIRIGDYPSLVVDAGLELRELTDVTEQTRGTMRRLFDGIVRTRKEFERRYGVSVQDVLDSASAVLPTVPYAGCLIMVATKP